MDRNQIQHDLALAYAETKLRIALERGDLGRDPETETEESSLALLHWYQDSMYVLAAAKDKEFLDFWAVGLK